MPSFSGKMPANGHSRAFFAADRDFVIAQERPNVFETHRALVNLHAVQFRHRVQNVRSRHAARRSQLVSARLQQIIERKSENVIGVDERAVAVQNSEAVGIAIGRQSGQRFFLQNSFLQQSEIFFRRIRPLAFKQNIAGRSEFQSPPARPLSESDPAIPPRTRAPRRKQNCLSLSPARRSESFSSVAQSKLRADE